ncbi:MAG: lipoprotein-releasing system ATP-binding protein LolD [Gammaproteobacteria bacterium]|nr:lipoprotein-releasing system ATP-binding protein LolD [Gammaproteobacteria bacterium]|tara:strand:- start:5185 stop:5853 length:669 start_codon:yes stop_codon:yes gene_type:complete
MLICKNINKKFSDGEKSINILSNINLEVSSGQSIAIVGASGSGKSTLLHVISGLESSCSGKIYLDNKLLSSLSENELCNIRIKKIGFIYQSHHLIKELNVRENISLPLLVANKSKSYISNKTSEIIEKVGLNSRSDFQIDKLSGGERQRVAIARSIVHDPKIIFADEPTGNLDKSNAKNIFSLLTDLANYNNSSLIVATHDLEMASLLNEKLIIENGVLKKI